MSWGQGLSDAAWTPRGRAPEGCRKRTTGTPRPRTFRRVGAGLLARGSLPRSAFPGSLPVTLMDIGSPLTVAGAAPALPEGAPASLLAPSELARRTSTTALYGRPPTARQSGYKDTLISCRLPGPAVELHADGEHLRRLSDSWGHSFTFWPVAPRVRRFRHVATALRTGASSNNSPMFDTARFGLSSTMSWKISGRAVVPFRGRASPVPTTTNPGRLRNQPHQ
jgi:hypothetical protein